MADLSIESKVFESSQVGFFAKAGNVLWHATIILPIIDYLSQPKLTVEQLADRAIEHINEECVEEDFKSLRTSIEKNPELKRAILFDEEGKHLPTERTKEQQELLETLERLENAVNAKKLMKVADYVLNHLQQRPSLDAVLETYREFMDRLEGDDSFAEVFAVLGEVKNGAGRYRNREQLKTLEKQLSDQVDRSLDDVDVRKMLDEKRLVLAQHKKLLKKIAAIQEIVAERRLEEVERPLTPKEMIQEMEAVSGLKLDPKDLEGSYERFHQAMETEMSDLEFLFPVIRDRQGAFVSPQAFEAEEVAYHRKIASLTESIKQTTNREPLFIERRQALDALELLAEKRDTLERLAHVDRVWYRDHKKVVVIEEKVELVQKIDTVKMRKEGFKLMEKLLKEPVVTDDFDREWKQLLKTLKPEIKELRNDKGYFVPHEEMRESILAQIDMEYAAMKNPDLSAEEVRFAKAHLKHLSDLFFINEKYAETLDTLAELSEMHRQLVPKKEKIVSDFDHLSGAPLTSDEIIQAQLFAIRYAQLTGREIEMERKALHEAYLDVEKRNRILQEQFKGELERGRGDIAEALGELKRGAKRNFWKAGKLAKDDPQRSEFKQLAEEHQQSYRALKEQRETFASLKELENVYQGFLALPKPLPVVEEELRVEVENRVTPNALTPADRALIKQIEAVIGTAQLQGAENNLAVAYGRFAAFAEAKRSVYRDLLIYGEGDVYKAIAALREKRDNAFFPAMSFSNEEERRQLGRKWSVLVDAVKELEAAAPELAAIEKIEKAYRPEPTKRETTPKTDVSDAMIDLLDQYKERPQSPLPRELTATDRLIQSALTAKPAPLTGKPPELKLKAAPWKPTQVTVTV